MKKDEYWKSFIFLKKKRYFIEAINCSQMVYNNCLKCIFNFYNASEKFCEELNISEYY